MKKRSLSMKKRSLSMKNMTTFFMIALFVCIATFLAFAANKNRDTSLCQLEFDANDEFPGGPYFSVDNTGSDSEGALWSTASSFSGFYFNEDEDVKFHANSYAYISCMTDNNNYVTKYNLHVKVQATLAFFAERDPEGLVRRGAFADSQFVYGDEGNPLWYKLEDTSAKGSANGENLTTGAQHNTSSEAPTSVTARDIEIYGCPDGTTVCSTCWQ